MDETGSLLAEPIGMLRANANYSSTISLITPFDLEAIISIVYSKANRLNDDITQYLVPNGYLKGKDLLDETNPLYQTVYDWNVFEIGVNKKALAYVAKYRSGILYGAIRVEEPIQPANAKNYKGTFGNISLPEVAEEFDYYICNRYNHFDKDILWTISDYAYFYNGKWNKSNYKGLAGSSTFEIPVDPNIPSDLEVESDLDLAVLLSGRVAVLEQQVNNLDNTKQDNLIAGENITITGNVISATGGGSGGGYEPDNITIGLNAEQKLEVKNNLEIDGGTFI
jgi:hypothetical protein